MIKTDTTSSEDFCSRSFKKENSAIAKHIIETIVNLSKKKQTKSIGMSFTQIGTVQVNGHSLSFDQTKRIGALADLTTVLQTKHRKSQMSVGQKRSFKQARLDSYLAESRLKIAGW